MLTIAVVLAVLLGVALGGYWSARGRLRPWLLTIAAGLIILDVAGIGV